MFQKSLQFFVFLLIALVLAACADDGDSPPAPLAQPTRVVVLPTPTLIPNFDVVETSIQEGEGLTQALLRSCRFESGKDCYITEFADFGIVWKGSETTYFRNKLAFNSFAAIEAAYGYTQLNDGVVWGTTGEVSAYAHQHGYDVVISGEIVRLDNGDYIKSIVISGGRFVRPLSMQIGHSPATDNWSFFVQGVQYPNAEAAYVAATTP